MMRELRLLFVPLAALLLAGCESMSTKARINPNAVALYTGRSPQCPLIAGLGGVSRRDAIDLTCFSLPGQTGIAYSAAAARPADRNRLEAALLKHSDDICVLEKGRMVANESATNASLSIATTALSTVSTIVGGELAKSILSGGAAITSGTQDHINANFYRNQIVQAITRAIDGRRSAILTEIVAKRQLNNDVYSVDEMIRLVNTYYQACSFEHGLQVLLEASVNTAGYDAII